MRKKYFLFSFMFCLILSGCTIDYNLEISDDSFEEYITIFSNSISEELNNIDYHPILNNYDVFYDKKLDLESNPKSVGIHYKYEIDDFVDASTINQCFSEHNIINDLNFIYVNLNEFSGCEMKNDFDIKIITKNKVLENNADVINGNTYIWHLNDNNKDKININIKIAKGIIDKSSNSYIGYILLGFFGFLIFIIILLFMKKRINRNSL